MEVAVNMLARGVCPLLLWYLVILGRSLMDIQQHACLQCAAILSHARSEMDEPAGYCDTCWDSRCNACGYWQELMTQHGMLWLCPPCRELTPLQRRILAAMGQLLMHYPFRIWGERPTGGFARAKT